MQVMNDKQTMSYGFFLTIPNDRLTPTNETVITFRETPVGYLDTIRAWFFPGEKVGDEFWKRVARQISEQFQRGDFTAGLLAGIDEIGRQLTAHFPAQPGAAINSLPDSVVEE